MEIDLRFAQALFAATAFAIGLLASTGAANALDGNELYSRCQLGETDRADGLFCGAYVVGTIDGHYITQGVAGELYCLPMNVTNLQVIDVVKRYLIEHPAERHGVAAALVIRALTEAFPCS